MASEPIFKQVETVQLAPDALVFINGSDTVKDEHGEVYQIRNDISDLSADLDIASQGTASFTIVMPDHSIRRFADRRYNALRLMSEIEIYFKGRFPKTMADGRIFYPYYPCFWGILTSINESYSDGQHMISVTCADILRWWEITNIAINPSAGAVTNNQSAVTQANPTVVDQAKNAKGAVTARADGRYISPYGNIFAGNTIPQILVKLAQVAIRDIAPIVDFPATQVAGTTDKIGPMKKPVGNIERPIMEYWATRFNQVGRSLRIFGIKPKLVERKVEKEITVMTKDAKGKKIPTKKKITVTEKVTDVELNKDSIANVMPYMLDEAAPNAMQTTTMSKLEVAKHCAEVVQFEFYMDVNGEIIFKPPFYNMDVRKNLNSVINDIDIISWGFTQSEAEICTRMDVTGQYHKMFNGSKVDEVIKGIAVNIDLAQKFGVRAQQRSVTWLTKATKCLEYAQTELNRMCSLLMQGTVTIVGRPELRLGYPVYVPARDAFYYIKSISHQFSFGGSFTTTLTLTGERKKRRYVNGEPIKNQFFRSVGALQDSTETVEGNSVAQPVADNNFLSQMQDLCIPNKKSTVDQVIEPNFVASTENTSAMEQGEWQSFADVKLTNPDPTKEFQTTDGEGYELIPFFLYAGHDEFNSSSLIKTIDEQRNSVADKAASKAQDLKPEDFFAEANPNNVALTLDNEDASMLNIYDKTAKSIAEQAQNNGIK